MYFIIAKFTPQSLNIMMKLGATNAIVTKPYSDGDRSLAMIITPTADIIVEATEPQKRLNPPLTETLAILIALVTEPSPSILFFIFMKLLKAFREALKYDGLNLGMAYEVDAYCWG